MAHGKVDVRINSKTGKARLRFYGVAEEQLESIRSALHMARKEFQTEHDTVALEAILLSYLNTPKAKAVSSLKLPNGSCN